MDQQLISSLKALSGWVDQRKAYDSFIAKLEAKKNTLVFNESKVSYETEPATNAAAVLEKAAKKAESAITRVKVLVWIVAVLAIVLSGLNLVRYLLDGNEVLLGIFVSVPIAAGIAAFCFSRISNGDGGCLSWLFGIGCALEVLSYSALIIIKAGVPAILFFICLAGGLTAGMVASKGNGWKEKTRNGCQERAKRTKEYQAAVKKDQEIESGNEQRRQSAFAREREIIRRQRAAIDEKLEEARQRRAKVVAAINGCTVFPQRSLDMLDRVIDKLENMRCSTVQEALRDCDAEDRQKAARAAEEAAAAAAAVAAAAAAEQERKRNLPGRVTVYATEDGRGKNAEIYVDGGYYGSINYVMGWTTLTLAPGSHSVVVIIHSQGYQFRSAPQSFYLEGGGEVTLKFALLGYNQIICTKW